MLDTAVQQALDLAVAQLGRLKVGDVDGYLANEQAYTEACGRVSRLDRPSEEEEVVLRELLTVASGIGAEIERMMDDTTVRIRQLNDRRRLATAYYDGGPAAPLTEVEF